MLLRCRPFNVFSCIYVYTRQKTYVQRMRPVSRRCFVLLGTRPHLWCFQGLCLLCSQFCIVCRNKRLNTEHYVRNPLLFFVNPFSLILANTREPSLFFACYIYEGPSLCTEHIRTFSILSWLYLKPFKTFSTLH